MICQQAHALLVLCVEVPKKKTSQLLAILQVSGLLYIGVEAILMSRTLKLPSRYRFATTPPVATCVGLSYAVSGDDY